MGSEFAVIFKLIYYKPYSSSLISVADNRGVRGDKKRLQGGRMIDVLYRFWYFERSVSRTSNSGIQEASCDVLLKFTTTCSLLTVIPHFC